eukprot:CAMPEP_0197041524 /NCGR_PEP_ID=MMETSP1384-20130603/18059_1 /TAXON_ID=29189 /ORGANISM="Ammonia sp." /LENGTH=263 /DNA_ID=CAMNT_0042472463 /DNA_START=1 /DNA_END=788 /DNA_ORIENTATION=+
MIIIMLIVLPNINGEQSWKRAVIMLGEIVWVVVMTFSMLAFGFYGLRMIHLLSVTNQIVAGNQSNKGRQAKTVETERRLKYIVVVLCIFFMVQTAFTVYFSINDEEVNAYWRMADLCTHLLCLMMICWMYQSAMKAMPDNAEYLESTTKGGAELIKMQSMSTSDFSSASPRVKVPAFMMDTNTIVSAKTEPSSLGAINTLAAGGVVMQELHNRVKQKGNVGGTDGTKDMDTGSRPMPIPETPVSPRSMSDASGLPAPASPLPV